MCDNVKRFKSARKAHNHAKHYKGIVLKFCESKKFNKEYNYGD